MNEEINTSSNDDNLYLTVKVGGQPFGIPVHCVHDVSKAQKITQVPLAPPEVAGALNLRGRIVTVINVGKKLGLKDTGNDASTIYMYVVIEHEGELYSLMVDSVGDVMSPSPQSFEQNPSNMEPGWRDVSAGVYRLDGELLVLLDIQRFFAGSSAVAAA
ncbi:MAG: chemotaxis protein CheW [Alphaproteobacteria bacterium]|jgi:purine-binding chemotaxis protein CheW|nr:chemotaxis protein CheW [Alphaproteobacteria bacterium]MBT4016653.1 chemotaxis protein CheW [Alphaproteobacteria bacterium]MBT7744583.1 chemotaxis protein CheW [Alphaproteobacteria bacterium]